MCTYRSQASRRSHLRRLLCLSDSEPTNDCLGVAAMDIKAEHLLCVVDETFVVEHFVDVSILRLACFLVSLRAYMHVDVAY
jgi:hypothetical protein